MEQLSKFFENIFIEKSCLYIVSTPIGNLNDVSLRCIKTLQEVDYILCEDTRVTKKLLSKFNLKNKSLVSYNDFNAKIKRPLIIKNLLKEQFNYAIVSDSGTPLISDPGYKLVKDCLKNKIKVTHIPGPTSVISGLILSGLPANNFMFCGFFEKNPNKKKSQLLKYKEIDITTIWFDSINRIHGTLSLINEVFGNRNIAVLRELTKLNEEIIQDKVSDMIKAIKTRSNLRGEIVIVIAGYKKEKFNDKELKQLILKYSQNKSNLNKSTKNLSVLLSDKTGLPRNFIYNEILKFRKTKNENL